MGDGLAWSGRSIPKGDAPTAETAVEARPAEGEAAPEESEATVEAAAEAFLPGREAARPEPEAVAAEPEHEAIPEEEELELTEKVETHGDLDVYTAPAETSEPPPAAAAALVGEQAASAAATSFSQLSAAILMPKSERTLEDVVRELDRKSTRLNSSH